MRRLLIPLALFGIATILHCSKPCKTPDMNQPDMTATIDMAQPIDMFCQVNPATELCLDLR